MLTCCSYEGCQGGVLVLWQELYRVAESDPGQSLKLKSSLARLHHVGGTSQPVRRPRRCVFPFSLPSPSHPLPPQRTTIVPLLRPPRPHPPPPPHNNPHHKSDPRVALLHAAANTTSAGVPAKTPTAIPPHLRIPLLHQTPSRDAVRPFSFIPYPLSLSPSSHSRWRTQRVPW